MKKGQGAESQTPQITIKKLGQPDEVIINDYGFGIKLALQGQEAVFDLLMEGKLKLPERSKQNAVSSEVYDKNEKIRQGRMAAHLAQLRIRQPDMIRKEYESLVKQTTKPRERKMFVPKTMSEYGDIDASSGEVIISGQQELQQSRASMNRMSQSNELIKSSQQSMPASTESVKNLEAQIRQGEAKKYKDIGQGNTDRANKSLFFMTDGYIAE